MSYPNIQNKAFTNEKIHIKSLKFTGACLDTVEAVLKQYNVKFGDDFLIKTILREPQTDKCEKYFIHISNSTAAVEAYGKRGIFRGVHTLMKLIENNELYCGEIEDYPLFQIRGYIEGFYGDTWEQKKRLSVMSLMAKYGLNTFYYAPKDDLYHREKWREIYPEDEYKNLKSLFGYATENEFDFYWCIGPGLTYHYTDKTDFYTLVDKIKSVYSIGIKNFGLLLDDIPWDFQYKDDNIKYNNIADAHIDLVNNLYSVLKGLDSDIQLTVCPTEYFGSENGEYIAKFGKCIPQDVKLFWTGQEICSRVLTCRDTNDFITATSHKPLFWDNYPVNDCEMFNEMHLGPITGRDKELYKYCDGLISNVMEYAECSKIPLITIADYLWNSLAYNAQSSLENAHREVLGNKADTFKYIADHLCFSCLNRNGGSQYMSDILYKISFLNSTGKTEEAKKIFEEYIKEMNSCLLMLKDKTFELFNEMEKWVEKFEMCCRLLEQIYITQLSPTQKNKNTLVKLLNKYNRDAVILTGFCLREAAEKTLKL